MEGRARGQASLAAVITEPAGGHRLESREARFEDTAGQAVLSPRKLWGEGGAGGFKQTLPCMPFSPKATLSPVDVHRDTMTRI